ncbi:MAG: bifunctional tRNA (5-methylaminomethyl-2-thiouridine)(34)-methyltransferase MnmD/FAD-dependent 5-carboxymethylaminomethyl-2-thiouridine(34) oxidoreductase MnmC [Bdellovibrionota bacterium]
MNPIIRTGKLQPPSHGIEEARLTVDAAGVTIAERFGDRYHSIDGAIEESRHIFLAGNDLPAVWNDLGNCVVAELGFGTGLNFLLTWQLWRQSKRENAVLHYYGFEQFPLTREQLHGELRAHTELEELVALFLRHLPLRYSGYHRAQVEPGVFLTLAYGDANDYLPLLDESVDVWFLDGFAPTKNPELWSPFILKAVADHSHDGTTLASYSVAGSFRSQLQALDFTLEKKLGFARKREMLRATKRSSSIVRPARRSRLGGGKALIVGAGLAGTAVARSFALRGWRTVILERGSDLAQGASGNRAGVLMPHLSVKPDPLSRFCLAGYETALAQCREWKRQGRRFRGDLSGVLRLLSSARLEKLSEALPGLGLPRDIAVSVTESEGTALAGAQVLGRGIYFEGGGWMSPPDVCRLQLEDAGKLVTCQFGTEVATLRKKGSVWEALDASNNVIDTAETVVVASGWESAKLEQTKWFPLERVRGQVAHARANRSSSSLRIPVCYDGYVLPAAEGVHLVGATFDHQNDNTQSDAAQNEELLRRVSEWVPGLPLGFLDVSDSRVSFRTMSRDRLPFVGAVPDLAAMFTRSAEKAWEECPLPGLYVSLGHGSRGLTSCGLAAEIIVSQVCGEPGPVEGDLEAAVQPHRFLARLLEKGISINEAQLRGLKVPHLR